MKTKQDKYLNDWKIQEECAEKMLPLVGKLYRERNIVLSVYGRSLVHASTVELLKIHRFARQIIESELSITKTLPIVESIARLDLAPARIDIGKLAVNFPYNLPMQPLMNMFQHSLGASTPVANTYVMRGHKTSCCTDLVVSVVCSPAS